MDPPEPLTEAQLAELHAQLRQAAEDAERNLAASSEDARPVDLDLSIGRLSRMDALQQQHMAIARRDRVELRRQQVRAALSRVEAGTYGDCLECGEPIGYARLRVQPEAPFCRSCQGGGRTP